MKSELLQWNKCSVYICLELNEKMDATLIRLNRTLQPA